MKEAFVYMKYNKLSIKEDLEMAYNKILKNYTKTTAILNINFMIKL